MPKKTKKYRMSFEYENGQRGAITYPSRYEADYHAERVRRGGGTARVREVWSRTASTPEPAEQA